MIETIRPQPRLRMPGSNAVAISMGVRVRSWKERRHSAGSVLVASDATGPPAFRRAMSIGPRLRSACQATFAAVAGSAASPATVTTTTE